MKCYNCGPGRPLVEDEKVLCTTCGLLYDFVDGRLTVRRPSDVLRKAVPYVESAVTAALKRAADIIGRPPTQEEVELPKQTDNPPHGASVTMRDIRVARTARDYGDEPSDQYPKTGHGSTVVFRGGFPGGGKTEELRQRPGDQPLPKGNDYPHSHDLVCADMMARKELGTKRYGHPLQPFNGRNSTKDAYEESLDQTVYLRNKLTEEENAPMQLQPNGNYRFKDVRGDEWLLTPTPHDTGCPFVIQLLMRA